MLFECPIHGKDYPIQICMRHGGTKSPGVWVANIDLMVFKDTSWKTQLTLTPSIQSHHHGRKPCGWYGSITNGEIHSS